MWKIYILWYSNMSNSCHKVKLIHLLHQFITVFKLLTIKLKASNYFTVCKNTCWEDEAAIRAAPLKCTCVVSEWPSQRSVGAVININSCNCGSLHFLSPCTEGDRERKRENRSRIWKRRESSWKEHKKEASVSDKYYRKGGEGEISPLEIQMAGCDPFPDCRVLTWLHRVRRVWHVSVWRAVPTFTSIEGQHSPRNNRWSQPWANPRCCSPPQIGRASCRERV